MIAALLRAQLLSLRGSGGAGRVLAVAAGMLWYGLWTAAAWGIYLGAASIEPRDLLGTLFSKGLLIVMLYWQLSPILSASLGASLDLKKLRAYPVSDGRLFALEVMLRLTAGAEMLLVLAGTAAGLARNPLAGAAPHLASALVVFAILNLVLASGLRSLIEQLLARRRVREVVVFLITILAVLPQVVLRSGSRPSLERILAFAPGDWWPWAAASRAALGEGGATAWLALAVWTALAFQFGRWQFLRGLRRDPHPDPVEAAAPAASPTAGRMERLYRLPGRFLSDPIAAIVEKELRTSARTPRFRLVFLMGFTFGLLVWLPPALRGQTAMSANLPIFVSLYALVLLGQVSYWNAFGFDRSAAQAWLCWPVSMRQTLAAKNAAAGVFVLLEMAAVMLACLAVQRQIPLAKIGEAFLVTPIVALYLMGAGNLCSVHFPRALNAEKMGQGGGGRGGQGLLLLLFPVMLLPVLLAFWARHVFESQALFHALLAFAAALGGAVYWIAMDSAVEAVTRNREKFLAELSRGDGPAVPA